MELKHKISIAILTLSLKYKVKSNFLSIYKGKERKLKLDTSLRGKKLEINNFK